jgi:hypothetical protein
MCSTQLIVSTLRMPRTGVGCMRSGDAVTDCVGAPEFGDFGGRNGGCAPSDPRTAAGIRNVGGSRLGMGAGVME